MQLAKLLHNEKPTDTAQKRLFKAELNSLLNGIKKGFDFKANDVVWNSPDRKMIEDIYKNVYHFAAAKNYHELRDLSDALLDGDKLRSFNEFKTEADKIIGKYNKAWLQAEYNQAVAVVQTSARWQEFQQNAEDMPYLQYQAIMDANTRSDHAIMNGVIKKITDPFWNTYYPPNGWGCRCEAIQLPNSSAAETPDDEISKPTIPDMFRTNFAKTGVVFPQNHAYFKRVPAEYEKQVLANGRKEVRRIIANSEAYENYKNNPDYKDCKFNWVNGGLKATHKEHSFDKKTGYTEKNVQNAGFKNGNSVVLEKEDHTKQNKRNIEGLWDKKTFEVKACETGSVSNICRGLKHAKEKDAQIAVLYFDRNFNKETFLKALARYDGLKNDSKQWKAFNSIICVDNEDIVYKKSHL